MLTLLSKHSFTNIAHNTDLTLTHAAVQHIFKWLVNINHVIMFHSHAYKKAALCRDRYCTRTQYWSFLRLLSLEKSSHSAQTRQNVWKGTWLLITRIHKPTSTSHFFFFVPPASDTKPDSSTFLSSTISYTQTLWIVFFFPPPFSYQDQGWPPCT